MIPLLPPMRLERVILLHISLKRSMVWGVICLIKQPLSDYWFFNSADLFVTGEPDGLENFTRMSIDERL